MLQVTNLSAFNLFLIYKIIINEVEEIAIEGWFGLMADMGKW